MSGLGLTFLRRGGQAHPTAGSDYIKFADEAVFNILMSKGVSSDGVGITKDDAAAVKSIGAWFRANTTIKSFDEFVYFTGVTSLGMSTTNTANAPFYGCTSLESIWLPPNITSLGYASFYGCSSLSSVKANWQGINSIYADCFKTCNLLVFKELDLRTLTLLQRDAFYGVSIESLLMPSLATLPAAIANSMTWGVRADLEKVVLSNELTSITSHIFFQYTALKELSLNWDGLTSVLSQGLRDLKCVPPVLNMTQLTSLGESSFRGSNVEKVLSMGETITTIPGYAFMDCASLQKVVIPASVTAILTMAFRNCTALQEVVVHAVTPPTLQYQGFLGASSNFIIYVPDESIDAYMAAGTWSGFASRIKGLSEYNG